MIYLASLIIGFNIDAITLVNVKTRRSVIASPTQLLHVLIPYYNDQHERVMIVRISITYTIYNERRILHLVSLLRFGVARFCIV